MFKLLNYTIGILGVADGVGGWRKYGIDPSEFSSRLMKHCADVVKSGDFEPSRPDLIIAKAFTNLAEAPRPIGFVFCCCFGNQIDFSSSTACVVVVHQNVLYTANLGDSGFLIYRNGKILHKSQEQTHYFNAPFQLTLLPETIGLLFFKIFKSSINYRSNWVYRRFTGKVRYAKN